MSDTNQPPPRDAGISQTAPAAEQVDENLSGSTATLLSPGRRPEQGTGTAPSTETTALPVIERNHYAIKREFAHGGIGRILEARDLRLDRPVALKELLVPGGPAEGRFVSEALVTARLQHPSIVPIYEAGRWSTGEPFYAMKLVSGRSLADVIAGTHTLEERLALLPHVLAVAEAVAYAHSEGIIHRDLKPANVLVGEFGETVVIDWGLAKDLSREKGTGAAVSGKGADPSADGGLTVTGTVMGTPAYMPPEQARGHPVDERADVYALGAILYHLLAGTQPYDGDSSPRIIQQVLEGPPLPLGQRQQDLPEDLLTLVNKAMDRDPARRYPTASELAEDLRRYQTGQIVGAHRYSRLSLLRRFVRRNRAAVLILVGALVGLAGVGAVSIRRIVAERDNARRERVEAVAARREAVKHLDELTLVQARDAVERDPNQAITWLKSLSADFTRWGATRVIAADARARGLATILEGHSKSLNDVAFSPDGRLLATSSNDHTLRLWDLRSGTSRVLTGHTDEVGEIAFSPDGRLMASGSRDTTIRLWDVATGKARILTGHRGPVVRVRFFADGRRLASCSGDGTVRVWDLESGESRAFMGHRGVVWGLVLSPDQRLLASTGLDDRTVRLWDVASGQDRILGEHATAPFMLAFSPGGDLLASGGLEKRIHLWNVRRGGHRLLQGFTDSVAGLAFLPDGRTLATTGTDATRLWDLPTFKTRVLEGCTGMLVPITLSTNGRWLACGGTNGMVRLWDLITGQSQVLSAGNVVAALAFSPDGQTLAAGLDDGTAHLFPVLAHTGRVLPGPERPATALLFSPDGGHLLSTSAEGTLRLWSLSGGAPPVVKTHPGGIVAAWFSSDGARIVSVSGEGTVLLWDLSGQVLRVFGRNEGGQVPPGLIAFSPDGRLLATRGAMAAVHLWDLTSNQERLLPAREGPSSSLAFSPDNRRLASGNADGTLSLWDLITGETRILRGYNDKIDALAFSPDGKTLASSGRNHLLRIWDVATGERRWVEATGGRIYKLAFSPDGEVILSEIGGDPSLRLWDARTGKTLGLLHGHTGDITRFAFSPDGTRLATASTDHTVRLWDLKSGEGRALRGHTGPVYMVAFSPDGKLVASAGEDGTVRLWPDDLPLDPTELRAWMAAAGTPAH